jgi:steroid delta-isomerase-like uncharacterized protein
MTPDTLKAIAKRWILGIWDQADFRLIAELASDEYSYDAPGQAPMGGPAFREFVTVVRTAFPDLQNSIESQIAEGDVVVTRGTTRGTHQGAFGGLAPTGRRITVPWVMFTTFANGRIIGDSEIYDALGMMTQLGAIPAAEHAATQ